MRIHSLPGSKRYAEDEAEWAELLHRQNEAAREILGAEGEVFLFLHFWGGSEDFERTFAEFEWLMKFRSTPVLHAKPDDEQQIVVAGGDVAWAVGKWDPLLRDVANYRLSSVVMLNPVSGEAFAPYDGGADLFLRDPERVIALRRRWVDWLSARPDGL